MYGDTEHKRRVLWVVNNVICNTYEDCKLVSESGLMSNVIASARDFVCLVRIEAFFCLTSMIRTLLEHNQQAKILELTMNYEIELLLRKVFCDSVGR